MDRVKCSSCIKEPVDRINVSRFISKLDGFFAKNDLEGAGEHILFWKNEAEKLEDYRGLLSVINEALGYYRRTGDIEKGLNAVDDALFLIDSLRLDTSLSGANIFINLATTLKSFGKPQEGIQYYDKAGKILTDCGKEKEFEFAALLNNKASALSDMKMYDEAEKCYRDAIEILKSEGKHDGEIGVSLVNLAHLYFDRDDNACEAVEETLDEAWEYINSDRQPHNSDYAFIISKCAPSFDYFGRKDEAQALREVADEIYGRN